MRPLDVASAVEDTWADPEGEFASLLGAKPVYQLLGVQGLPTTTIPAVDQSVHGGTGYHVRSGKHDLTWCDWRQYLAFAERHFGNQ